MMKNKMRRLTVLALLAISSTIAMAQSKITGKIVEVNGEPIIGATVKVKGSAIGTVSDLDGNFTVEAEKGSELEVSYIGYKTQAVKVTGNYLEIKLLEDAKALSEVVVVGFGVQKKVNLTGAVSVVDGDELAQRPVANATQALQGVVPGLQIASTSGTLDSSPSINVRGTATIGEGSSGSPLILIDGMEGDLNTINPQDIESISVLKDAAASSIYGSRQAHDEFRRLRLLAQRREDQPRTVGVLRCRTHGSHQGIS